jgi:long-subunit acyl-CoA synthetase (AMP-forming)
LPTGDVFVVVGQGYYSIVDRVKDIFKNNKGQTISPKMLRTSSMEFGLSNAPSLLVMAKPTTLFWIVPDYQDLYSMTKTLKTTLELFSENSYRS